jgi:hypothetical protein
MAGCRSPASRCRSDRGSAWGGPGLPGGAAARLVRSAGVTEYCGRNRPSLSQAPSQAQPCAACSRASSLYSSSSGAAGCSTSRSTAERVEGRLTPSVSNARSTSAGESGLTRRPPNAAAIRSASSRSLGGGSPAGGRGPSRAARISSCLSGRHGTPAAVISTAASADADSAAISNRNAFPPVRANWPAYTSTVAVS